MVKKIKRTTDKDGLTSIDGGKEKVEDNRLDLVTVFWYGKIFGGKLQISDDDEVQDKLIDSVEMIIGQGPKGEMSIMSFRLGDMNISEDCLVSTMPPASYYYSAYLQCVANILPPTG